MLRGRTISCKPLVPVAVAAAVLIAAGCGSSSKNNKGNSNSNAFGQPGAATVAASVSATSPAASASAASAAASATKAGSAAAASATKAPAAASAAASAASGGARDAALQAVLEKALLTDKDLPAGYSTAPGGLGDSASGDLSQPGETASAGAVFFKTGAGAGGNPLAGQLVFIALGGFKDGDGAKGALKELKSAGLGANSGDTKFEPLANPPKIGDETLAYKFTSQTSGVPLSGYAIAWRRGKVDAIILLAGSPAPKSVDEVTPLAKKQDDKLKAAGQ